ncbi:protein split ends-like [Condylostylus longicornis]|uniref:protein split ends-like n=1 Tax=Condylostylus longicornis TaxID=2530218 RepID=UPI00244DB29B|nr:protein split ends-like [Condylostylus longicornis]
MIRERKSRSDDRSRVSEKSADDDRSQYSRSSSDKLKISKTTDSSKKSKSHSDKNSEKEIGKKVKQIEKEKLCSKESLKQEKNVLTNKENCSKGVDDQKSKNKTSTDNKIGADQNKQSTKSLLKEKDDKIKKKESKEKEKESKEKECKEKENKEKECKERENKENKGTKESKESKESDTKEKSSKKFDIFHESSPNTPEPESTTPEMPSISSVVKIADIVKPETKMEKSVKLVKEKDKMQKRTANVNANYLSFSDELFVFDEEPEDGFPLTKDGTIQAIEGKRKPKKTKRKKLTTKETDDVGSDSSPDTEDYQDMWEEDEDFLPSSQMNENNKSESSTLVNDKTHEEILKNIKVEIDDELEVIKRNQDVIENEIFKNLGGNTKLVKIKKERISTEEPIIIKQEKKSDESCSSSDDDSDNDDSTSTSSSSSNSSSSSSSSDTSVSSNNDADKNHSKNKKQKKEEEIKDGFSTPLFVNPSPPPELAMTLNIKEVAQPPKLFSVVENKAKERFSNNLNAIEDSIEEMEQNGKGFDQRKDLKTPISEMCKSLTPPTKSLSTAISNNSSTALNNPQKELNHNTNQKFVIAMQDIYEQFLQSVTNAGVDLSCGNEPKSPKSFNKDLNKEKVLDHQLSEVAKVSKTALNFYNEADNKKDFKTKTEVTSPDEKVDFHVLPKISPIKIEIPKPKRIQNIIPLDEINIPLLINRDLQTEVNSLKLSELKSPQFDLAISPKSEEPVILLAPEKISTKLSPDSKSNTESNTDDSTSSDSDDSDDTSSTSSDSDSENPRSMFGVDIESLKKFSPDDRKNLRALEKRLNTLQSWSAVDDDDKEVFKGLKNILEREIELIIRKYIPFSLKTLPKDLTTSITSKESPKEIRIQKPSVTTAKSNSIPTVSKLNIGIFDSSDNAMQNMEKFLPVTLPVPTIFSIGAEMAKNSAALQKPPTPVKTDTPKSKDDSSKSSVKSSSSKSSKSDNDSKRRRSKSSDRSHKSSSKRSAHSPSRKSPSKHTSKDSKRERSKSPREERRKSSPHHKSSSSSSNRRSRQDSPTKKQSSRHKHRRSPSIPRITPRRSRSPCITPSKRFRARTPTPSRTSKQRTHEKVINKHIRKSDFHRSRSFSRSRSRSITPRESNVNFRGRGRIRVSVSPIRRSFSPRRASLSPRRSISRRRSASPRGRHFSRSPIPFRPPSPSVSPPPSGNDSSRSPKLHSRSLSRSRTRSRSSSPHTHKIRRTDAMHHPHWISDHANNSNQYYAENTYGYATSPSRMTMTVHNDPPRRIDTVIGSRVGNDTLYQSYGQYSSYDYIQSQSSGISAPHYSFDFNGPQSGNGLYPNNENCDYYFNSDYQDNRNYLQVNQIDSQTANTVKTVVVQKGNVLEIVPSAVLPNDVESSISTKLESKENLKLSDIKGEICMENIKKEDGSLLTQGIEQKKKKIPSWKREVHRRQMLAAVLKLHRDSDGNMKSILIKPEEKPKEKKRVLFADGIKPGNGPVDEKSTTIKKEKKVKKERKEKRKPKLASENKENTNLMELLNVDVSIDAELENAPPPPPPPGSPPSHLEQPICIRPDSPPDFTYFHFDAAVSCMYFSKNPIPIPPRLLNGSFPSPPTPNQQNQSQPQQQQHAVQLHHPIQLQTGQSPLQIPINSQSAVQINVQNQTNVLSSIANSSERLSNAMLIHSTKMPSPVPVISAVNFSGSSVSGVRSSLVQRFNTVSHFGPSNTSMSSCNFSIPPPNIPPPMIPSQHNQTVGNAAGANITVQTSPIQNQRNLVQHSNNVNVQQQLSVFEQMKRGSVTLPFQAAIQTNKSTSVIAPVPAPIAVNTNSNSPAFSSDSCFWKTKDNTGTGNTTILTSSPLATQTLGIHKIIRNETKNLNLSPSASPIQKKITSKLSEKS